MMHLEQGITKKADIFVTYLVNIFQPHPVQTEIEGQIGLATQVEDITLTTHKDVSRERKKETSGI